jgi:hypothetical protein
LQINHGSENIVQQYLRGPSDIYHPPISAFENQTIELLNIYGNYLGNECFLTSSYNAVTLMARFLNISLKFPYCSDGGKNMGYAIEKFQE